MQLWQARGRHEYQTNLNHTSINLNRFSCRKENVIKYWKCWLLNIWCQVKHRKPPKSRRQSGECCHFGRTLRFGRAVCVPISRDRFIFCRLFWRHDFGVLILDYVSWILGVLIYWTTSVLAPRDTTFPSPKAPKKFICLALHQEERQQVQLLWVAVAWCHRDQFHLGSKGRLVRSWKMLEVCLLGIWATLFCQQSVSVHVSFFRLFARTDIWWRQWQCWACLMWSVLVSKHSECLTERKVIGG